MAGQKGDGFGEGRSSPVIVIESTCPYLSPETNGALKYLTGIILRVSLRDCGIVEKIGRCMYFCYDK